MQDEAEEWLRAHPKVSVMLPARPEGDWRTEQGYGWIAKLWFRTWGDSRAAITVLRAAGWEPTIRGRKVRVYVTDGFDGQRLAELVLQRWPKRSEDSTALRLGERGTADLHRSRIEMGSAG